MAHFLAMHAALSPGKAVDATDGFIHALETAELPGNAREVENIVCHALAGRESDGQITEMLRELSASISERLPPATALVQSPLDLRECLNRNGWNLGQSLNHIESLIIQSVLEASSGNQTEAARRLGISPRSIYNKLHRSA